jgi:hypothetical protein
MKEAKILMLVLMVAAVETAAAQSTTNVDLFDANLIVNGHAEQGGGASPDSVTVLTIPSWEKEGFLTVVQYDRATGNSVYPKLTSPGPTDRGVNFFAVCYNGTIGGGPAEASASQTIDLSSARGIISSGEVLFELSGYFGGYDSWGDYAELTAKFLDQNGTVLNAAVVGQASPDNRGNVTGLLERKVSGKLPPTTRKALIVLHMVKVHWEAWAQNTGYADNLSFTLFSPSLAPNLSINSAVELFFKTEVSKRYQLQFINGLETSTGWNDLGAAIERDGSVYKVIDSVEPGQPRRFYRLKTM